MGAFQSSYQSADVSDALDLTLEATVSNGALPPRYETPSASQFSLFANETVTLNGREWVPVRTGLSFKMPFMLILLVRGTGFEWEVQDQVVDYDDDSELVVHVRNCAFRGDAEGQPTRIVSGTRVAAGVVMPIARPAFALYETDHDNANDDESV